MSSDEKKILATLILEIIGRPPEHLKETLTDLIKEMGKEKGVKVVASKINEPNELEKEPNFFTTFAEIDIEVNEMANLFLLTFKYMPAHIEVVSPERLTVDHTVISEILNELTRRLHAYDEVARVIQTEKMILETKLRELTKTEEKPVNKKKKSSE
jgi:hypothetical protein